MFITLTFIEIELTFFINTKNRSLREDDGLCWFQISCNKSNGGGALCQSYHKKTCIRVFRSSELQNKYAPILFEDDKDEIQYRYDGLYTVRAMWDPEGSETEQPPSSDQVHTFFLMRQPKRTAGDNIQNRMNCNNISLQELWNEIQKRRGVRKPKDFAVPEPVMDIGPIGNMKRRIASSRRVLKSEEKKKVTSVVRKKRVNVVPLQSYAGNGSAFHNRAIYSSESDSSDESEEEIESEKPAKIDEPEVTYHDNGRPKRKSAAVARTYLKEVMHNKYGDTETPQKSNTVQSHKRSIWSVDGKFENEKIGSEKANTKRYRKDDQYSLSDASVTNSIQSGVQLKFSENQDESLDTKINCDDAVIDDVQKDTETDPDVDKSSSTPRADEAVIEGENDVEVLEPNELEKASDDNPESANESESTKGPVNPESILVGSRVNVEYRNTLFKATVRRTRVKSGLHEFSIHYDGNKKSNVHWIPLSMIHDVRDEEPVNVSPEVKPKRGRKKKVVQTKPAEEVVKEKPTKTNSEPKQEEIFKFAIGSEVYVNYKSVLYLSLVLNAKKNKRGNSEYLVHYDGFKKTADRWMKESALFEVNEETTQRFNEERGLETSKEASFADSTILTKKEVKHELINDAFESNVTTRSSIDHKPKEAPVKEAEAVTEQLDMGDLDSGVEFLPGSCVFVVKANALYLAKMVKRRKKGRGKEYLVQFDGMSSQYNEWISLSEIYELNPKSRRIYERTADLRTLPEEDDDEDSEVEEEPKKQKKEEPRAAVKRKSTTPKAKANVAPKMSARISRRSGGKGRPKKPKISQLYDMQSIESGVEFLPGSTLFVQWKNGLYLGKMLKKRGKGEHMEYLIHYDGYKSSQDEWVSVSMVFEINPQTKRAFNKQKKA